MITQQQLKKLLKYDPKTGIFIWLVDKQRGMKGRRAGYKINRGYIMIGVNRKPYLAHRLAWLYIYGKWPKDQIDHINRDRLDNRITNLREATQAQNAWNAKMRVDNLVGVKGIKKTLSGRYEARLQSGGKYRHLGTFKTKREAAMVVALKRLVLHGDFARQVG
jgi:hypothetical protein